MKLMLAALLMTTTAALAHEAPKGWSYPFACCSNMDCKMVDDADVKETDLGYIVKESKDVAAIGYHDKRVKDSPDGSYHWCAHQAGVDEGRTICLFVPPKGF